MCCLPLVLDILLARVHGHIAQLDDFLQALLQVLDVTLLLGNKLSAGREAKKKKKQIENVSTISSRCKQKMGIGLRVSW